MSWKLIAFLVCLYGFLKEYRPSEAYLVAYLTGPWKNLTVEQVDNEIFPIWTYAYLLWLVPVFLLTDFLRYKPVIILEGASYIATWVILLWGQGVLAFKFMDVCYGLATATEIAYYSYLFAIVSEDHFQTITSFTRASILAGRFFAYLTGQMLVSFKLMDYQQLNIISFVSCSLAFVLALSLKQPKHSDIFHKHKETNEQVVGSDVESVVRKDENHEVKVEKGNALKIVREKDNNNKVIHENNDEQDAIHVVENYDNHELVVRKDNHGHSIKEISNRNEKSTSENNSFKNGLLFLWEELKMSYSDKSVVAWSCWWAFASCGHLQVQNYIQNLWEVITPEDEKGTVYNGAVEAFGTLISSLSVLAVGFLPVNWSRPGLSETTMALVCLFNTAVLTVMGQSESIWVSYVLYSVFRATYHTVITLATLQIARSLTRQRYGFVFGTNMFMALVVETLMTVIVVDKVGLNVDVQTQFTVYGGYFGVIGCMFMAVAVYIVYKNNCSFSVNDFSLSNQS